MSAWEGTPETAQSGTTVKIKFCDATRANTTITVAVDRDDSEPADDIEIVLDGNGCGETDYLVPTGPSSISFSTEGHPSHEIGVTGD